MLTKTEFEKHYAQRSNLTVAELRQLGITIEPCTCGYSGCSGWQAVTQQENKSPRYYSVRNTNKAKNLGGKK